MPVTATRTDSSQPRVRDGSVALVAFGGNVIHKTGQAGTFADSIKLWSEV